MTARFEEPRGAVPRAPTTSALGAAYLWFPLHSESSGPSGVLYQLKYEDAGRLMARIAQARQFVQRENGLEELVYRESLAVVHIDKTVVGTEGGSFDSLPSDHGRAVHPSLRIQDSRAELRNPLWVHTDGCFFQFVGAFAGQSFTTHQALHSEVMLCALATCREEEVSVIFRALASLDPWTALGILERELVFLGVRESVRGITPLLRSVDLTPLLRFSDDSVVRERAIANLGRLGRD